MIGLILEEDKFVCFVIGAVIGKIGHAPIKLIYQPSININLPWFIESNLQYTVIGSQIGDG